MFEMPVRPYLLYVTTSTTHTLGHNLIYANFPFINLRSFCIPNGGGICARITWMRDDHFNIGFVGQPMPVPPKTFPWCERCTLQPISISLCGHG